MNRMVYFIRYEEEDDEDGDGPNVTNLGSRERPVAGSMFCIAYKNQGQFPKFAESISLSYILLE